MDVVFSRINNWFEQTPALVLKIRWWILAVLIGVTVWCYWGVATRFQMDMTPEAWFEPDAPPILDRDEYRRQFGSDEDIFVLFQPASGDVFSENALRTLESLQNELEKASQTSNDDGSENPLSRIVNVDSLYNGRYQIADGDTLITRKLISGKFPETQEEREERRRIAFSQDNFVRMFVSDDSRSGGIRLHTDFGAVPVSDGLAEELFDSEDLLQEDSLFDDLDTGGDLVVDAGAEPEETRFKRTDLDEYLDFMKALRLITEQPQYDDFSFFYIGSAVNMEFTMVSIIEAGGQLIAMVVVIVVLLWCLFRSLSAVVWPLTIIALSMLWTLGVGAWMGIAFSSMLILTQTLVIAIAIAGCVHVLSTYLLFRREGNEHHEAIRFTYRKTGMPIFLTSITTMAGILSLSLSDMPIIVNFGITSTMGVGFSFIFIMMLLPLMLQIWRPSPTKSASGMSQLQRFTKVISLQAFLRGVAEFTRKHARTIVISYAVIFCWLLYGASQVVVDSNFANLSRDDTNLNQSFRLADEKLMGGLNMEIFMDFGRADALKDPSVLHAIDDWQQHIEDKYPDKVVKTFSLADVVKNTNKVMNADDPAYEVIPDQPRLAAQLLYLFDNSNPADRRDMVSDDYSRSHISIMLQNDGSAAYKQFFGQIEKDIQHYFSPLEAEYPDMKVIKTGTFYLMMSLMDHISWTQIKSFSFALLVITLLMIVTLGSKQTGVISMIPNLIPAVFTVGVMGLLDIPLNMDSLIVAPIIIGIAVDDTIHFLVHYRNTWRERGDINEAVQKTLEVVGPAIIFTSIVLGLSFSVLAFSDYLGLAKPGALGSAAIFVALLSDLLFLPALIYWLKPKMGVIQSKEPAGPVSPVQ